MYQYLLVLLIIIILFFVFNKNIEHWQNYRLYPYHYVYSGSDPLYFYRKDRYRKPYMDGFLFYQSYPYPHLENYP